jgi:inosose dehydratase
MQVSIANAPCSWGVEFADDPRNPPWTKVLDDARAAGYRGMELGPIGFMPEDPAVLGPALVKRGLSLVGGVVFRPFHDPTQWEVVKEASRRTCQALRAHGATQLVLIDSISPRREPTSGRGNEAERMSGSERTAFLDRLRTVARMAAEEFGLAASIHAHAGGWIEFEDELENVLDAIDPKLLGICLDTGHSAFAGFDPVAFYLRHADRVAYLHFKDVNPLVKKHVVENRIGFYQACAKGLFCNLGTGAVDFVALKAAMENKGYRGWATVEQDCDPAGATLPMADAMANLSYLKAVGMASGRVEP